MNMIKNVVATGLKVAAGIIVLGVGILLVTAWI